MSGFMCLVPSSEALCEEYERLESQTAPQAEVVSSHPDEIGKLHVPDGDADDSMSPHLHDEQDSGASHQVLGMKCL